MKKQIGIRWTLGLPLFFALSAAATDTTERALLIPFPEKNLMRVGNEPFKLGGYSGLQFEGAEGDELLFWTHTDRGPNGQAEDLKDGGHRRPFLMPDYQLRWVHFAYNPRLQKIRILEQILLTDPNGEPLSGLPNLPSKSERGDEYPVDRNGRAVEPNLMGLDPESICRDDKGQVWMGEEYRPSIVLFSSTGRLLKRYVPKGSFDEEQMKELRETYGNDVVQPVLPAELSRRQQNRGFEGLTCGGGKVFAMLQSPMRGENKGLVPIYQFNPETERVEQTWSYELESEGADKIGDITLSGPDLLVIEQSESVGSRGFHRVYRARLENDHHVRKELVADLVKLGYSQFGKVEGLTIINDHTLAVVNDNDFGVNSSGPAPSVLGVIPVEESLSR